MEACWRPEIQHCCSDCRARSCCDWPTGDSLVDCSRSHRGQRERSGDQPGSRAGSKIPPRKIECRRRQVLACSACAIHAPMRAVTPAASIVPARQRSRSPRKRLRNRRTFSSGRRRHSGMVTKPRKVAASHAGAMKVLSGWSRSRRPNRKQAMAPRHSSSTRGSSWKSARSST